MHIYNNHSPSSHLKCTQNPNLTILSFLSRFVIGLRLHISRTPGMSCDWLPAWAQPGRISPGLQTLEEDDLSVPAMTGCCCPSARLTPHILMSKQSSTCRPNTGLKSANIVQFNVSLKNIENKDFLKEYSQIATPHIPLWSLSP